MTDESGRDPLGGARERVMTKSIALLTALALAEVVLIWAMGSQVFYMAHNLGGGEYMQVVILFGVIGTALLTAFTAAVLAGRSVKLWGEQKCKGIAGIDARFFYKGEVLITLIVVLGTLMGTAIWDLVTAVNALIGSSGDFSVFLEDFLLMDMVIFEVVWPLWLHALLGALKMAVFGTVAVLLCRKVGSGEFCEV
jgi:hypothetical protein